MARPGGLADSGAVAAQTADDDRDHAVRVKKGQPDCGAAGFAVFSLALQIPERFRSVGVVKDVPAGGLVKDAVHGVSPS